MVLLQVTLGVLSVTTLLGLVPVPAHLGVGALLRATMWVLGLGTRSGGGAARYARPVGGARAGGP